MSSTAPKRKTWPAALLSLLTPGLGHLYAGDLRGALVTAIAFPVSAVFALSGWLIPRFKPFNVVIPVAVILLLYFLLAIHAFRKARNAAGQPLRRYQRWSVYATVLLVNLLFVQPSLKKLLNSSLLESLVTRSVAMEPTLLAGDHFVVTPIGAQHVDRGQVVVFSWPNTPHARFVMRVAGTAMDTIQMRDGRLFVNGKPETIPVQPDTSPDSYDDAMNWQGSIAAGAARIPPTRREWGPLIVPAGSFFVLGDNRENSVDSRFQGLVPSASIRTKARTIYFSRDKVAGVRWNRIGRPID